MIGQTARSQRYQLPKSTPTIAVAGPKARGLPETEDQEPAAAAHRRQQVAPVRSSKLFVVRCGSREVTILADLPSAPKARGNPRPTRQSNENVGERPCNEITRHMSRDRCVSHGAQRACSRRKGRPTPSPGAVCTVSHRHPTSADGINKIAAV
jgi:hypothetical protein